MPTRFTDRWLHFFDKKRLEISRLKSLLQVTIYGSFQPTTEKERLLNLVHVLRRKGYKSCDIVGGELRQNPQNWKVDKLSQFYLENSDVNFLVFTHEGKRLGVTDELGYTLHSPVMRRIRQFCTIFDDFSTGYSALTSLQLKRIEEIGMRYYAFSSDRELHEFAVAAARDYIVILINDLRARFS